MERRVAQRGYLLLEALFALFILILMALLLAATLPISTRSNTLSADSLAAQALVSRKLAQVQSAGYGKLNGPALAESGVVDGTPAHPTATENADGTQSAAFLFTQIDALSEKLGVKSTAPEGRLFLAPFAPAELVVEGRLTYTLVRATAVVRWTDSQGLRHFASATTLVPKVKVNG